MPNAPIKIMLVDDHAIVRSGFRRLLDQERSYRVVSEAGDAESAYKQFVELSPDVVVVDLSMPGLDGLGLVQQMFAHRSDVKILVFTMHEDAFLAERAIKLGANGFVTKSSAPEVLISAIAEIMRGQIALSPDVAQALAVLKVGGFEDVFTTLTAREFEVFRLFASGHKVAVIAALLGVTVKTVGNYLSLIKQKVGAETEVELVLLAQRHKIC